jgi:methionine-rich copper-binding protein CopC
MRARAALISLASAGLVLGAAVPAMAHTELVSTTPKQGTVVKHLPKTLVMTFTEPPQRVIGVKVLRGTRNVGKRARLNPKNARQILTTTSGDAAGAYSIKATLIAPDGDKQLVTYAFRVRR